jgi:hypothetical protein
MTTLFQAGEDGHRGLVIVLGQDREHGPDMYYMDHPDRLDDMCVPWAITETMAREMIAGLTEGLSLIAAAMPEICVSCGDHCLPREGGACWRCEALADLETNKRRRKSLRPVA